MPDQRAGAGHDASLGSDVSTPIDGWIDRRTPAADGSSPARRVWTMHILFDLDGTLTDSSEGITRCINHALLELGHPEAGTPQLRGMIGAPLAAIFASLLRTDDQHTIDRAIAAYRCRFDEVGIYENRIFPGIEPALQALHGDGHRLQVVTAKPRSAAERVVRHFGLFRWFHAVHGPALDERTCDKALLIAAALDGVRGEPAVMIGDRAEDIHAARRSGIAALGVAWGYGLPDELLAAGADDVIEDAAALVAWVNGRRTAAAGETPHVR